MRYIFDMQPLISNDPYIWDCEMRELQRLHDFFYSLPVDISRKITDEKKLRLAASWLNKCTFDCERRVITTPNRFYRDYVTDRVLPELQLDYEVECACEPKAEVQTLWFASFPLNRTRARSY